MCELAWIPCDSDHTGGSSDVFDAIAALVKVAKFTWKATKFTARQTADFTRGLAVITVALYLATRWTGRQVWRGYRWWATRPVNRGQRQPVAAITDKPAKPDPHTAMTLAELLRTKEPANR